MLKKSNKFENTYSFVCNNMPEFIIGILDIIIGVCTNHIRRYAPIWWSFAFSKSSIWLLHYTKK